MDYDRFRLLTDRVAVKCFDLNLCRCLGQADAHAMTAMATSVRAGWKAEGLRRCIHVIFLRFPAQASVKD